MEWRHNKHIELIIDDDTYHPSIVDVIQKKLISWKCTERRLDEECTVVVIMFVLSPAFYVIDHLMQLEHLEFSFGIKEKALTW